MLSYLKARRKSKKTGSASCVPPLVIPKAIRDELRMCVALQGYSALREGEGKTLHQQYHSMQHFFMASKEGHLARYR
jgi:hypothetical protein